MTHAGQPVLAIIGGTGALGSALAMRWSLAGYRVILGSRSREKAVAAASAMRSGGLTHVSGEVNAIAARVADIVVVAVPYASHRHTLEEIAAAVNGKIVVDTVVPLQPPKVTIVHVPTYGSAAQEAQIVLGSGARVVSAFHNVSAAKLADGGATDCDVLVFANDKEARAAVEILVTATGARPIDGGPLANSIAAEAMTAVLIGINRRYKSGGAGIRITGLPAVDEDLRWPYQT